MKRVTRCYNCKQIIRIAGSFKAGIEESIINGMEMPNPPIKEISLCRKCAELAGYKVKCLDKKLQYRCSW